VAEPIEDEVFVDLVGDGDDIMFDAQVADEGKLLLGEDPAGGIVGRVEEHGFGLLFEGAPQLFSVELVVWRT
jgi:hypothetical protein